MTMFKKLFFITLLLFGAASLSAQSASETDKQALYNAEVRNKLNIDYSMPDFSTSKLDGNIIGSRLAQMLQRLQDNYTDFNYNQYLSMIVCEQYDSFKYVTIERFKIMNISKTGNVITIKSQAKLGKNLLGIKNTDITMVLIEGVPDGRIVNILFSYLGRYIKE